MEKLNKFKKKIRPQFKKLEVSRKVRYILYLISYSTYIIPFVIFYIAMNYPKEGEKSYVPLLGMLIFFLFLAIIPSIIKSQSKNYTKKFKQQILEKFIKTLYPDIYYSTQEKIGGEILGDSKLFRADFGKFLGEDYLEGTSKTDLKFQFSKLHFSFGMGEYRTPYSFDGIFLVLEVPEINFPRILVISKTEDESSSYSSLSSFNSIKANLRKVRIARINPSLNKLCNVYAIDEGDSYKVLNTEFTKTLEGLVKNRTKTFRISFYKNRVYVALNEVRDLFNVNISISIDGDILMNRIYKELEECIYIVNSFSQAINSVGNVSFEENEEEIDEKENNNDLPYDHLIDFDEGD